MDSTGLRFTMSPQLDVGALNTQLSYLKKSLGEMGKDISFIDEKELQKDLDKLKKDFKETIDDTNKSAGKVSSGMNDIEKSTKKASESASLFNKAFMFNQIVQSTYLVSSAVDQITASSIQYEASLAAVGAITGFTGENLNKLGTSARQLALEFGGSATDQLKSFQGILSKLGPQIAEDSEALALFGRNINILSAASGDDAATSMNAITNAMLQMGLATGTPIEQAQKSTLVINALAAGAQVGAAEIPQVADALVACGVAAKGANMDIVDVNAAIQVMAVGGKTGAEAGTALRNVLGLLQKASGPAEETMRKLGTSSEELGKLLNEQGLDVALSKVRDGMNGLGSDAERNAALMQIFGTENAAAAGILMQNLDKYQEFSDGIEQGMQGVGSAFEQAEMRMSTTEAMISRSKAIIEDVLISLGSGLGSAFTTIASTASTIAPLVMTFAGLGQILPTESIRNFAMSMLQTLVPSLVTTNAQTGALTLQTNALSLSNLRSVAAEKARAAATWLSNTATKAKLTSSIAENAQSIKSSVLSVREATAKTVSAAATYLKAKASATAAATETLFSMATLKTVGGVIASIGAIVGLTIAKGAMAVATGAVTAATWLWNAALMANPIVAIAVGVGALIGGVLLLADAFSYSAKEREEDLKKENEYVNKQIENNKKQQERVNTNQKMIESYEALGKKVNRTAEEEKQFADIQLKLAETYPGVVSGTASFSQNLDALKKKSTENTAEIKKYQDELKGLQSKRIEINIDIKKAQAEQIDEEMDDLFSSIKARRIVEDYQKKIREAKDEAELDKLGLEFRTEMFNNPEFNKLSAEDKQQFMKLADNYQKNISETMKLKNAQVSDILKNSLDEAMAKGAELSPATLADIAKKTSVPVEQVEKMYSDIKKTASESKISEAINESLKINGNIGDAELAKSLADEYQQAIDRINELKDKRDSKGITESEQQELDNLGKKAAETADKIGAIVPQSKTNFRTVVDEAGNIKEVFDINIDKVNEFGSAQNTAFSNTDAQKKFDNALQMQITTIEKQKDNLVDLKKKIDSTNDPEQKRKFIAEYNKENEAINKNKSDLIEAMVKGSDAGLSAEKSIQGLSKALGISSEEAKKMLLSKALQEASKSGELTQEKIEKIATKYNVSVENAKKLYEEQKKNTAEAQNTANAAGDISKQYEEAYKKLSESHKSNIEKIKALESKALKEGLSDTEKNELQKYKQWASYSQQKLKAENKIIQEVDKMYDASYKEQSTSQAKSTKETEATLQKIQKEAQEIREKNRVKQIEDEEKKSREEFKLTQQANLDKVNDEIKKYTELKAEKGKLTAMQYKEMLALEDKYKAQQEANAQDLLDFEAGLVKKRIEANIKAQADINNANITAKKAEIESIKKVQADITSNDEYIESVKKQAQLERELLKLESDKQIQDIYSSNDKYKKAKEEQINIQAKLAVKQKELTDLVFSNAESSIVDKAQQDIETFQSKLDQSNEKIKSIEADINETPLVKNIVVEINYKSGQIDDTEQEKLEQNRINSITNLAELEREITIIAAKKTYDEELRLAKGNTAKKLVAEYKYLESTKQAQQKYLKNTTWYYNAIAGLSDSLSKMQIRSLDNEEVENLENDKRSIAKERNLLQSKYAQNKIDYEQYVSEMESLKEAEAEKDIEIAEANAERQKAIWAEYSKAMGDYFSKMYEEYANKTNASITQIQNAETTSAKAKAELLLAESELKKAHQSGNIALIDEWTKKKDEATAKEKAANTSLGESYNQLWLNFSISMGANMAQMLIEGENFWKATALMALKGLKALIPVLSAQILGMNLATADSVATVTAAGWAKYALTMAGLYAVVGLAEAAVQGAFRQGVTNYKGKGTGTSDSNIVRISNGESVITAKGTQAPGNAELITWMNNTGKSYTEFIPKSISAKDIIYKEDYKLLMADRSVNEKLLQELKKENRIIRAENRKLLLKTNELITETNKKLEKVKLETYHNYNVKAVNNVFQESEKIAIGRL